MNLATFYSRSARFVCLSALAMAPLLLYGAKQAFDSNSNNIIDWLPHRFEETQRLFWFVERFGSDEILAIGWEGCSLDDERVDELARRLREPVVDAPTDAAQYWFREVFTGRQTLVDLTEGESRLTRPEALARMTGWLIGRDGTTTCVVAMASDYGQQNRRGAIDFVRQAAAEAGIAPHTLYIAGPTADSVAVDIASNEHIVELGFLSAVVGMFVTWLFLRDVRLVTILMLTATFAWGMSLSCLYFSGGHMDAVLLVMPGLVFVLAVSGGMHVTNYYTFALQECSASEAPARAIRSAWLPCTLATLTTMVGVGSLMFSQLVPIRRFGFFASTGVLMTLPALLVLWPCLAQWWPPQRTALKHALHTSRLDRFWAPLAATTQRHSGFWLLMFGMFVPGFAYGVTHLTTSVQLQHLFRPDAEIIRSCNWLERQLGALVPVEVVVRFPGEHEERDRQMLQRALLVEELRAAIARSSDYDSAMAATTFAPPLPDSADGPQMLTRRLLAARLPAYRERFTELRMLAEEPHEELWRISARVGSTDVDYGPLLASLEQQLQTFLAERSEGSAVTAEVCGAVPLIYLAQQRLLSDLISSYLVAFGLILAMMTVLLRSLWAGMLAMLPNVIPAIAAFGALGLAGIPIDIGTMMTASVAMGIAVDDTVHFLIWFRRGIQEGLSRDAAIPFAYSHCATPMLRTTVICGLGLLVFMFSPFVPVSRFGGIMAWMLLLALAGDLLLLPALLSSRLGRAFVPRCAPGVRNVDEMQRAGALVRSSGIESGAP
ncbi:MAG: MMPL family transporter [Planctomycetaceae bacterium]|nr:MMPL family transporter [Planctomycetaceae bacterium]